MKAQSSLHKKMVPSNYSHLFTHNGKKVKSKPFQSLVNYHGAQYWIYIMLHIKFSVLKVGKKYFEIDWWNCVKKYFMY